MFFRLIVIIFLIYLAVRLFQRFDNFLTGRNRSPQQGPRRNVPPPRQQERYGDRIEDARWEDVTDRPERKR